LKTREVTVLPGDSPKTFERVRRVMERTRAPLQLVVQTGAHEERLAAVRRTKLAWVGHTRWPGHGLPAAVRLREELGVEARHRPICPLPGLVTRYDDIDLLVIRETTEDVYAHLEHESIEGVFESLKVTTAAACERIARHAFEVARKNGRHRVTIVHKSNILKLSDGLFLRTAQQVAKEFPDIQCDEVIVDALCMKLVLDPSRFDVLLCGNLYGDILGDLCAGLVGGATNAPSIDYARDGTVVFGAGHGDRPEVDGTDAANPLALLLPAISLLRHVGCTGEAEALHEAIARALEAGNKPVALGGGTSCEALCSAIEQYL
jgi:isocitrate dehydrogenase (NAD+)